MQENSIEQRVDARINAGRAGRQRRNYLSL